MASSRNAPLRISEADRDRLESWTRRGKTAQSLARRARLVLACAEPGATISGVAAALRVSRPTVALWRRRFAERGPDGLLDEPRPGAPRSITDEQIEPAVVTTLEGEPPNATHWSTRALARAVGQSAVVRIWRALALAPHRSETFKLSRDPLFIDKVRDIVGSFNFHARRDGVIGKAQSAYAACKMVSTAVARRRWSSRRRLAGTC